VWPPAPGGGGGGGGAGGGGAVVSCVGCLCLAQSARRLPGLPALSCFLVPPAPPHSWGREQPGIGQQSLGAPHWLLPKPGHLVMAEGAKSSEVTSGLSRQCHLNLKLQKR
jgi:hypothetical protein